MEGNSNNTRLINTPSLILDELYAQIDCSRDMKYIKLDDNVAAKIISVLYSLPELYSKESKSGVYRVEFPEGINGVLTNHNGGYLPTLRDPETGRIVSQGTLYPVEISGLYDQLFSALSILTSQYYLHQINAQLQNIQSQLDHVLDFLYSDKASEIYAEITAVMGIYRNYASIMSCTEQRIACLQTIQQAKIFAERNIQFYRQDMNRLVDKGGKVENIRNDLHYYTQSINLYGICATTEIVLSQNYEESYLKFIENDLRTHVTQHNQSVSRLQGKLDKMINVPGPIPIITAKQDPGVKELINEISSILGDKSPVKGFEDIINQIRTSMTSKSEYIIDKNGAVYQRNT